VMVTAGLETTTTTCAWYKELLWIKHC